MFDKHSAIALSKAQKLSKAIPPDLPSRTTKLEMDFQEIDASLENVKNDVSIMEELLYIGFSGSISIITDVDFINQKVSTKNLVFENGILTGVA